MRIATYDTLFGKASIATVETMLCGLTFGSQDELLSQMGKHKLYLTDYDTPYLGTVVQVLNVINYGFNDQIRSYLCGTPFQKEVWKALQTIPSGTTQSYQEIAKRIGRPEATRAVANAVGANPLAIVIPCHRVIRTDGSLGGYRWGKELKKKLLLREGITTSFVR